MHQIKYQFFTSLALVRWKKGDLALSESIHVCAQFNWFKKQCRKFICTALSCFQLLPSNDERQLHCTSCSTKRSIYRKNTSPFNILELLSYCAALNSFQSESKINEKETRIEAVQFNDLNVWLLNIACMQGLFPLNAQNT